MKALLLLSALVIPSSLAWADSETSSIAVAGDIAADGKLISNATVGPPLEVASSIVVQNLNADVLDGLDSSAFAKTVPTEAELTRLQGLIDALRAELDFPPAPVPRTGQTTCYDDLGELAACGTTSGIGQDGHLQVGTGWPNPRFSKNGDGTVADNLTGLIWLEDADCAGAGMFWPFALRFADTLYDGSRDHNGGDCGLDDGSQPGDWRLPNVRELLSLLHYEYANPPLPNTNGTGQWAPGDPFTNVFREGPGADGAYWTSTTANEGVGSSTEQAWAVFMIAGDQTVLYKFTNYHVWPVKGGR